MDENDDPLVQVSDDGSVAVLTVSEQRVLHGRSIPDSSIGGSELGTPSSSTEPCGTEGGAVIGCGAPPPPPHVLFCARLRAAAAAVAATDGNEAGFAEEGDDDDDEEFPTDAEIALALRTVYARHRHDLTLTWWTLMQKTETELGGADLSSRRMIETTIALIKHEEAEAARGRQADNTPTTPVKNFDDDDSFHPEKEVEDPFLVELAVAVAAPWDSGEASAAAAAAAVGLRQQLQWMIGDAAPADASATGQTYNDITKSPPPYLRCVFSPLSSLPPVLRCTASSLPHFFVADAGVEAGSGRALREDVTRLFGP